MKERIILYGSSLLGLAETSVICIHLAQSYPLPIEAAIFIMAIGSGLALFSSNLINTFFKIERLLPAAAKKEMDLRLIAFRQLHDLFLLQSVISTFSFLYFGTLKWIMLPLAKEVILCIVQMRLHKESK